MHDEHYRKAIQFGFIRFESFSFASPIRYFSIFCGTLSIVVRARRKTPGECSGASNNVRYANLINFNWPFQGEGREAGKF